MINLIILLYPILILLSASTCYAFNYRLLIRRPSIPLSRCLVPLTVHKQQRIYCSSKLSQIEDDGYSLTVSSSSSFLSKLWNGFRKVHPGTLILVRHGETVMNYNNTFTGWIDTDLSERGIKEIEHAASLLLEKGYNVDVTYTSRLKRAIRSAWIMNMGLNQLYKPVFKSWRLNERMYGDLEGKSKAQIVQEMGEDAVQQFRTGFFGRPPPMQPDHPHWHGRERKYSDLNPDELPTSESLQDTMARTEVIWNSRIKPDLMAGKNVMVIAHGNSLRGIVKIVDNLTESEITRIYIPNGIPLVFKFNRNMTTTPLKDSVKPLSGQFLEKEGLLKTALAREEELARRVPGYEEWGNSTVTTLPVPNIRTQFDPILNSLNRLNYERQLMNLANNGSLLDIEIQDQNKATKGAVAAQISIPTIYNSKRESNNAAVKATNSGGSEKKKKSSKTDKNAQKSHLVIIRHGKTEYNKLGIFTGWEDAPLSEEGRNEARKAGTLLVKHGMQFDVVYTSWLSRAIETAWLVLNEMDLLWLPISKSWRLNERMYGALTGLSKSMIKELYGDKQFKQWRRSYITRPPPTSSFSSVYPGNEERYVMNVKDVRISLFESFIRSISHGKLELHRKFPKTESLKDCMSRTIPYYTNVIVPNSIDKGKSVLIASSENAIRGLLMYLCDIPEDKINEVEIPTGLPLVYNFEKRCIQLLDDGNHRDNPAALVSEFNFGSSPDLLFKPCDQDDFGEVGTDEDDCYLDGSNLGKSYKYNPIISFPDSI